MPAKGKPATAPAAIAMPAAIAVPAAVIAAAVIAAAVTVNQNDMGGRGRRRGGDRYRLSRRGIGHGRRCCGNSDRGSTRRQRWRNVLQ